MRTAMLLGHGSPDPAACAELSELRQLVATRLGAPVDMGVLEFPAPGLPKVEDALAALASSVGVAAQPLILFDGLHGRHDIPRITKEASILHRLDVTVGNSLGQDAALIELATARLADAGIRSGDLVLFIGRGSSGPLALSQTQTVSKAVAGAAGLEHVVCYTGISRPNLAQGMTAALAWRPRRVVALPYLLHTGVLFRRVPEVLDPLAREAGVELLVLPHIGNCPALVELVATRLEAML
jgi:sirohydrochlorin cobaltochelatase